jgi:hypothetical protein
MLNMQAALAARERHKDLVRAAERRQLVAKLRATRPARPHFYRPLQIRLGRWLVVLGLRLQGQPILLEPLLATAQGGEAPY